jgi:RimJ/RimL family protein N-acetyltransferase
MTDNNRYRVLNKQVFTKREFSIVPIRKEDRYKIMKWRNEQIYHLRQTKPLMIEDQNRYFSDVVSKLFEQEKPKQILFSYLEDGECIGYGGLVHINWVDKNAEISFIMDTIREQNEFKKHWSIYLDLIEQVAFKELGLHKIYTYAFDLRPHLYSTLEENAYNQEAVFKEHSFFNGKFIDVVIHSKISLDLILRPASLSDLNTTFQWATDKSIRKYSLNSNTISFDEHTEWFINKIKDATCYYYIVEFESNPIGSIRFDRHHSELIISYLLIPSMQGRGIGKRVLHEGVKKVDDIEGVLTVKGFVLADNIPSYKIFEKLGYKRMFLDEGKLLFTKNII